MSAVEGYANAGTIDGSAGNAAPFGGRRRGHSAKKLRLVKKKTVRRMLAKKGLKMRGGADAAVPSAPAVEGGRRHKKTHKKSHRRRSIFGMKY